jgi:hypothetical protein
MGEKRVVNLFHLVLFFAKDRFAGGKKQAIFFIYLSVICQQE